MATPRRRPDAPARELDTRSHRFRRVITRKWLRQWWFQDVPLETIANDAGCSEITLRRYADKFGFPPRPQRDRVRGWDEVLTEDFLRAAYLEDKLSAQEIAGDIGCSGTTVCRYLDRYGIRRRGHQAGVDNLLYEHELTNEYLGDRLQSHWSVAEIAREAQCSITAVADASRRLGLGHLLPRVRPPRPPCADEETLRDLYESGASLEAIATELGVSRTKVRADLSRFGIRPYSRPGFRETDNTWTASSRARKQG